MKFQDKLFLGFIFAPIFPILFFLLGWWGSFPFFDDYQVVIFAISVLIIGIIIDLIFLKSWIAKSFEINNFVLILIYLFYSICFFGFFMGVPCFNLILGPIAGIYTAKKILFLKLNSVEANTLVKNTQTFTGIVLFLICIASATIALNDPFTIDNLKGMFNLQFELTEDLLKIGILIGGIGLIIFQYLVTKGFIKLLLKH